MNLFPKFPMESYISIDPAAIQHATNQQARHREFQNAVEVVKQYCAEEKLYFYLSNTPLKIQSMSASMSLSANMPMLEVEPETEPERKKTHIRQPIYEAAMKALYEQTGHPFTLESLYDYACNLPQFAGVSIQAFESAMKRAVHATKKFERTEVNGKKGFIVLPQSKLEDRSVRVSLT